MTSITQFETLTAQLPAPRSQDPLDGTEGELRRLTRHLLTLMLRYQGRSPTPRGASSPLSRRCSSASSRPLPAGMPSSDPS